MIISIIFVREQVLTDFFSCENDRSRCETWPVFYLHNFFAQSGRHRTNMAAQFLWHPEKRQN